MRLPLALFLWLSGCAEEPVVETFGPTKSEDIEENQEVQRVQVQVQVEIDIDPRPTDIPGGNLYLAGFAASPDPGNLPEMGSTPIEFRQLGIWVSDWPWAGEVELVDGLRYIAIYALGEEPSPQDRMSDAQMLFSDREATLKLEIGTGRAPEFGPIEQGTDEGVSRPDGLTAAPGVVRIDIYPRPSPTDRGQFWLVGFSELNAMGHPPEGAVPVDSHELGDGPDVYPMLRELPLYEDLYYIAMYGHGEKPEPDHLKSGFHQLDTNAEIGLELVIQTESLDNREEADRQNGQNSSSQLAGKTPIPIQVRIDIQPPPERSQGKYIWLVGFSELNARGEAAPDSTPADSLDLGVAPSRLPLERELPLYAGLHYTALVGAGERPSPQDRRSPYKLLDPSSGHSLELVIGASPSR